MARVLFVLQTNEAVVTQSKPAFVLLGNPLLFDNMFVRPHLALFVSLLFCKPSFQLFLCLSIGLFPLTLHVDAQSKGTTSQVRAKRATMQVRRRKPKRAMFNRFGGLDSLCGYLTLSLLAFFQSCFRVLILVSSFMWNSQGMKYVCFIFLVPCQVIPFECRHVSFIFPTLCLGCIPWVWQFLIYISCTLLGHTLGMLAMFTLLSRFM